MGFLYKFVLALFYGMMLSNMTFKNEKTEFIYLNNPETLKTTGILHQKKFDQNTNVRYFFHYKNGTKSTEKLFVKSKYIIRNLKYSYNIDKRPEAAGAKATLDFMQSKTNNDQIELAISLKPNETLSGMIEGTIVKDDFIIFKFGQNNNIIRSIDVYQNAYKHQINLEVNQNSSAKYRLGSNIENTVKGQYGNDIYVNVKAKDSGILSLKFSPRGGAGLLVFENRGKIYKTNLKPAYDKYEVMLVYVEKDKIETFKFIPLGGLNYPIELDFSLQTYILKEAKT